MFTYVDQLVATALKMKPQPVELRLFGTDL